MKEEQTIKGLPKNWKWMKLGEAAQVLDNLRKPINSSERHKRIENKSQDELFPYYGATGQVGLIDDFITDGEYVLVGEDGAPFLDNFKEKAYKIKGKTWVNNHAHILKERDGVSLNDFILHYLNSINYREYVNGTTRLKLTKGSLVEIPFPVPPKEEQEQIVSKIEELFSELDKGIEELKTAQQQLKVYRQAVLSAGTSGMLTDSNSEYSNTITIGLPTKKNKNWKVVQLTDVAKLESGHTPRKDTPAYWENGNILWLSLQDIRALDGKVANDTKYKTNALGIENSSARLLPEGTVCFCRDISVGYVTIMGKEMSTTQHFANWLCKKELNNRFLMYSFMGSRDSLIQQGQGTTVRTIYMPDLKELRIQLPTIEEQQQIVQEIESRLSVCDKIEETISNSLKQAEALRQSILKKAFEGKLN
ncbi:MAG: hypothetical protein EOO46_14990 [Flavobacterium sp.]|nr:MAG: hypothetical protein EOO46_14990 [Flavobacterium sp.]